jgi:hypothetical protein
METGKLLKLAKICQAFEAQGMPKESDMIFESLLRLANWQGPYMNEPLENRKLDYKTKLEGELEDADEERQEFPRYNDQSDILVNADPADENLENQLHPGESNAAGGIKNVWYDGPSSLEKGGRDWGRTMEERDMNAAAGQKYKNLSPNFS